MSRFFRNMDLYKGIVLAALVLLPLGGWLVNGQTEAIAACKRTIAEATRPNGLLEEIGSLQRKVEVVVQNKCNMSAVIKEPANYFQSQLTAAGGASLKVSDYTIGQPKVEGGTLPGSKQKVQDTVIDIVWPRKDFAVPMDFLYAVLFNAESGAGMDPTKSQSIWKLRNLEIANATDERLLGAYNTPPAELQDKWNIRAMSFVRREPAKDK